jgi:hypothetical protein
MMDNHTFALYVAKVIVRPTGLQGIIIFVWLVSIDSIKTSKLLCRYLFGKLWKDWEGIDS